jgi:hypothetical protein
VKRYRDRPRGVKSGAASRALATIAANRRDVGAIVDDMVDASADA